MKLNKTHNNAETGFTIKRLNKILLRIQIGKNELKIKLNKLFNKKKLPYKPKKEIKKKPTTMCNKKLKIEIKTIEK